MKWIFSLHVTTGLLAGCLCGAALLPAIAADSASVSGTQARVPDFMVGGQGWNQDFGRGAIRDPNYSLAASEFIPVPGSPLPVSTDPAHPFITNNLGQQPTWRVADLNNPNLTEWAKDGLKKSNDMVAHGFQMQNRSSRCWEMGVPALNTVPGRYYFLQTPKQVAIIWQPDQIVRHVYLDVPHSKNPKPSWNGESIGHYEGDTLVVDTIGISTKTFVDNYRTPHSDNLHVVERFRMIDGGKRLEIEMTIEDPAAFVKPWKALHHWALAPCSNRCRSRIARIFRPRAEWHLSVCL
jgi:hypothetical protein